MSRPPRVTVFIPVFNRAALIGDAIASVLAQTYRDFELLIVDDGSTDDTRDVVRSFGEDRIRLICNIGNRGIPYTRNRGLDLASGEFIALLDSDDRMRPTRLQQQVAYLDNHHDIALLGTWGRAIDAAGRLLPRRRFQPIAPADVDAHLLFRCCISNRSVMGRTSVLRHYGYDDGFSRCQDYDLFVRMTAHERLGNLPQILVEGREHADQYTRLTADDGGHFKRQIAARQLADLGVSAKEEDLAFHVALSRPRQRQAGPPRLDLRRAEEWLLRLLQANERARRYDQRALSEAAAEVWLKLCFAAWRKGGRSSFARFLRSPLRRGAVAGFGHYLRGGIGSLLHY